MNFIQYSNVDHDRKCSFSTPFEKSATVNVSDVDAAVDVYDVC